MSIKRRFRWLIVGREKFDKSIEAEKWCKEMKIADDEIIRNTTNSDSVALPSDLVNYIEEKKKDLNSADVVLGDEGNLHLMYNLIVLSKANRIIETGVAFGWSSLVILSAIKNSNGRLVSTDKPVPDKETNRYIGIAVPNDLRENWVLYKEADISGLEKAFKLHPSYDLCHYDSDKSYEGRMRTYPKLWKSLKPGGIFISDDIGDNMAFKEFAEDIGKKPYVSHSITSAGDRYVGILVKDSI